MMVEPLLLIPHPALCFSYHTITDLSLVDVFVLRLSWPPPPSTCMFSISYNISDPISENIVFLRLSRPPTLMASMPSSLHLQLLVSWYDFLPPPPLHLQVINIIQHKLWDLGEYCRFTTFSTPYLNGINALFITPAPSRIMVQLTFLHLHTSNLYAFHKFSTS